MRRMICEIYDDRPEMCREYPRADSYMPTSCGYFFPGDGTRRGSCDPECEGACCKVAREGGEPEAAPMPEEAGGEPCKHLVYVDESSGSEG